MATITDTPLQELAAFTDPEGAALSVYLNLDPSVTPTQPDVASHVRSAIDTLRKQRPGEASHDARVAFDTALARIEEYLESGDFRDDDRINHGVAVFAHGEDTFHTVQLADPVEDRAVAGQRFELSPLAAAAQRSNDLVILLASREQGRAWLLTNGDLRDLFDEGDDAENRHKKGGWAQSILQRWTDRQAEQHLQEVVETLERVHDQIGRPPVLISATEEHVAFVREQMSQGLGEHVIGSLAHLRDLTAGELLEQAREKVREHDCRREAELLERHAAQVGRGEADDGSADAALAAVSDARAEWLLLHRAPSFEVYRCPQCDRLAAERGPCPIDGATMQRDEQGENAVVSKALLNGTNVWRLIDIDRTELDAAGGIGVIVRF